MDAYAIAQLISGGDGSESQPRIRYGTVTARNADGTLSVVPDGQDASVKVVRCCWPKVGGRCVILTNGTEWLAIGAIGEEDAPVSVEGFWITESNDDPAVRWPGTTWTKIANRGLYGSGTRLAGETAGAETHTLVHDEMPGAPYWTWHGSTSYFYDIQVRSAVNPGTSWGLVAGMLGRSYAHNNLQPIHVAHHWRRDS